MGLPHNIYKEIHNQEKSKKNVIVFGFQEQTGNSNKERYRKDKEKVGSLLDAIRDSDLTLEYNLTYKISRLGGFNADAEKPRPLLISFNNSIIRDMVLYSCKNLKGQDEWSGESIVPDLTKTQQKLSKSMRIELQKEVDKKNNNRKESEIEQFEFGVRGHYGLGNLRIVKTHLQPADDEDE